MDVVYILGRGSLVGDDEIKYSIRSLKKNMVDLGAVFVVGEMPKTTPFVKHISAGDIYLERWKNMLNKVRMACADNQLTDDFLLMNDDFFMLEPFTGEDFPYYRNKRGNGGPNGMYDFALHCPIRLNKEYFLKMPLTVEMGSTYSPRSFYCNFYKAPGTPCDDCILRLGKGMKTIEEQLKGRDWFSVSDIAMTDTDFIKFLEKEYPEPSSFE